MKKAEQFNEWNQNKQFIDSSDLRKFFINPREIWFTKMGINIGFEENGKKKFTRPVIVIKKVGNLFFTVALTTKGKKDNKFYHLLKDFNLHEDHNKNSGCSSVILSQVKVMDKKRFEEKIGIVSAREFEIIKEKLTALLL